MARESVRRDGDRMDGAAHKGTVADGERKSGEPADASSDQRRTHPPSTPRRGHLALSVTSRDGVACSCGSPDDDPLQPAANVEVEADERGETPPRQQLDHRSDDAATERGG